MKKIKLSEKQMKMISEFVLNETDSTEEVVNESLDNDRYVQECTVDFNFGSDLKFEGNEVSDIESIDMKVTFLIEVEHKSWGIKSIYLYDIQGPEEIDIYLDVYEEGDDDFNPTEKTSTLKLEWGGVDIEDNSGQGMIGIDRNVEIDLENDSEGNIIVSKIIVQSFTI